MKHKTIPEALQFVAEHPGAEISYDTPVWQAVCSNLIFIANNPDPKVRGSLQRSTKAQKMVYDRLVGRRRPGTHPATVSSDELEFTDLTIGILGEGEDDELADADAETGRQAPA